MGSVCGSTVLQWMLIGGVSDPTTYPVEPFLIKGNDATCELPAATTSTIESTTESTTESITESTTERSFFDVYTSTVRPHQRNKLDQQPQDQQQQGGPTTTRSVVLGVNSAKVAAKATSIKLQLTLLHVFFA